MRNNNTRSVPDINISGIWGTWNIRPGTKEIIIDFFVTDGSLRDPWVAPAPLSAIPERLSRLTKLAELLPSEERIDENR